MQFSSFFLCFLVVFGHHLANPPLPLLLGFLLVQVLVVFYPHLPPLLPPARRLRLLLRRFR